MSSLVFLVLYVNLYRAELESERTRAAEQVNQLLQTSLENAMLKRDLEGLRVIVERLGQQAHIDSVFITDRGGEIRFANTPSLLGGRHPPPRGEPFTEFVTNAAGRKVLRSVNPVANQPVCETCHGSSAENPRNGTLYVEYDAAPIVEQARRTTLVLMGAGAIVVVLNIAGGWWFIRRNVLAPIQRLTGASRRLTAGDLGARAALPGVDELSELGHSFDRMADELKTRIDEGHRQREFLQQLVDAIPDGVRVITPDYRVILVNKAYREQLKLTADEGLDEPCHARSHGSSEPCPPTLVTCPVRELRARAEPVKALHRHLDRDGRALDVEIHASRMRGFVDGAQTTLVVESIRDLSKEVQYSHDQKLSELGKLATGVAHEIYNPLTSVRLALQSFAAERRASDGSEELEEYLEIVDREIDRCISVTERLLKLGMAPDEHSELVDVTTAVEDTLSLVRWEMGSRAITLRTELAPDARILGSDSQIRMLTLNLVQNAIHAMPSGGTLVVATRVDPEHVVVEVRDSGVGIPREQLSEIFHPFYSRRADGTRGAGLGLPIVRAILERCGGRLEVESEPGRGSTFAACFPSAGSAAEESA
ncbi:MAG: HAMP domain-containing protein [Planctomycetes bacterium]|nr:HAMP domain-containing protein [Planctomycetota bacterium]